MVFFNHFQLSVKLNWLDLCDKWHLNYLYDIWFTCLQLNHSFHAWIGINFYYVDIWFPYGRLIFLMGHLFLQCGLCFPYFYCADIWLLYGHFMYLFGWLFCKRTFDFPFGRFNYLNDIWSDSADIWPGTPIYHICVYICMWECGEYVCVCVCVCVGGVYV